MSTSPKNSNASSTQGFCVGECTPIFAETVRAGEEVRSWALASLQPEVSEIGSVVHATSSRLNELLSAPTSLSFLESFRETNEKFSAVARTISDAATSSGIGELSGRITAASSFITEQAKGVEGFLTSSSLDSRWNELSGITKSGTLTALSDLLSVTSSPSIFKSIQEANETFSITARTIAETVKLSGIDELKLSADSLFSLDEDFLKTNSIFTVRPEQPSSARFQFFSARFQCLPEYLDRKWRRAVSIAIEMEEEGVCEAAHLGREVLRQIISFLAPDKCFTPQDVATYGHENKITRKMRLNYIRRFKLGSVMSEDLIVELDHAYRELSGLAHREGHFESRHLSKLEALLKKVAGFLKLLDLH